VHLNESVVSNGTLASTDLGNAVREGELVRDAVAALATLRERFGTLAARTSVVFPFGYRD